MNPKVLFLILFPLFAFSQSPQKINFQSILRNTNGEVVANKNVKLKISIQTGSMMDSIVYSETHLKTTDASGLMSLKIGSGNIVMGRFDSIKWGKAPHFIKLEADFNGGNNFVLLGTQELMSVPYALYASNTDTTSLNLTNRFNSKVNISDTSTMLSNYRNALNNKLNIADTISMLANYKEILTNFTLLKAKFDTLLLTTPVFDIDGNQYGVSKINNTLWLNANLKVTRYNNGDSIPKETGWKIYGNDIRNDSLYGKLYSYNVVKDGRKICPIGWKIPNQYSPNAKNYWSQLQDLANNSNNSNRLFLSATSGGINSYGWNGELGGQYYSSIGFIHLDDAGYWWNFPDSNASGGCEYYCTFTFYKPSTSNTDRDGLRSSAYTPSSGSGNFFSVRCVKDY